MTSCRNKVYNVYKMTNWK